MNKSKEYMATVESVEELLREGATYIMAENPRYGTNLIPWASIDNELKKGINLNNCPSINTMDEFILDGVCYHPVNTLSVSEIRKLTGLSQQKFGDKYGIPLRTIQDWEAGVRNPPKYVVALLERAVREDFKIE